MTVALRGLTWNHARGLDALVQASRVYSSHQPGMTISWSARSLAEFEDVSLRTLAPSCDLLAIDHPYVGEADADACLMPLDELLPESLFADQAANSVGPSYRSYAWNGHQWALAIDAAAQVSAYRPDLLARYDLEMPSRVEELGDFAASDVPGVAIPANPMHLYASFLTLCQLHAGKTLRQENLQPTWWRRVGIDVDVAVPALESLYRILLMSPPESLDEGPIEVLEKMRRGDTIAYVPFIFGYVNYSRVESGPRGIEYANVPTLNSGPPGSLLGGVGLAVSAHCRHPDAAAQFTSYVASERCQRGVYFGGGGQPGHRSAWVDEEINRGTRQFFSSTLETVDNACVRPRSELYPEFQRRVAPLLHELVTRAEHPKEILHRLNDLWRAFGGPAPGSSS